MSDDDKPSNAWELLHQETWWVNEQREWVRLDEIDLPYARDLWSFVCQRATRYGAQVAFMLRRSICDTAASFTAVSDEVIELVADQMWEEAFLAERKTDVWFCELEFVKALRQRLATLEAEEKA